MNIYYIQITVFLTLLLSQFARSEFYTAIVELEKLLQTEGEIVKMFENYLKFEEDRLEKVRRFSKLYEHMHKTANHDVEAFLSNPINAFLLVKRLTADWKIMKRLIYDTSSQVSLHDTTSLKLPNQEDLRGAAEALVRLQTIYLLDTATIARGQIKGISSSSEFTAEDCLELGRQLYNEQNIYYSLKWLHESVHRLEKEVVQTTKKTDILEYMAFGYLFLGNSTAATNLWKQILTIEPDHRRALNNLNIHGVHSKNESTDDTDQNLKIMENAGIPDDHPKTITSTTYERLCRGESLKTPKEESVLYCYYTRNNDSYLLLQPVKVEVLNLKPWIVMYYDVISDKESSLIKSLSIPRLEKSGLNNATSGESTYSSDRISKRCWLYEAEHPLIARLSRRIEAVTGLSTQHAEPLHALNYGIGGHFSPHQDFADEGDKAPFLEKDGNRIATWLFYLSDVLAGGFTVFPSVKAIAKPKKGAAAFWYNLHKNGTGDINTEHAGCPVLTGSKWVANKWLHEVRNEFKRPCSLNQLE